MERFKVITAVHLILIENNKILLQRRYNTGYEDGNYSVVAGHVEENESVIETMQREALEEIGINIEKNYGWRKNVPKIIKYKYIQMPVLIIKVKLQHMQL